MAVAMGPANQQRPQEPTVGCVGPRRDKKGPALMVAAQLLWVLVSVALTSY